MSKVRIYTLAKDLGVDNAKMLELLDSLGVSYKSVSSTIEEDTVELIKQILEEEGQAASADAATAPASAPQPTPAQPEAQSAPQATATATAEREPQAPAREVPHRAPVVTIMGHVDHGKTSLLDYIRKTKVAAKEAGGITQHVGAFEAKTSKGRVVFIDTPGHEAFTTIRARGANVADIAIIVIAADDSLMPQTREAIAHAQAAKVPMLVAINKVDLPQADPERVKTDLTQLNLVPEEYGGDLIVVPVSAKTGEGVEDLLEYISLTAELEDLRADPRGDFSGVIIESRVDRQAGVLATVMVQQGTLHVGDFLVVGENYGKVKAMTDSNGGRIKEAGPSTPVQVLGFSEAPSSGEKVVSAKNEHAAREIVAQRVEGRRDAENARIQRKKTLEEMMGPLGETRTVNLILRADTQGSLEAIQGILAKKETEDVKLNVMLAGIGSPTEGDVLLASTAEATILCFNVTASGGVKKAAEQRDIEIKSFRIIYELIDEVDRLIRGNVEPVFEERYLGRAEVRMVIRHPKSGNIAGSYVTDGMLRRNARAKVTRGRQVVYEGTIVGLKRFKDDVREVQTGYECGINLDWNDVMEGDIIEASEMVEVAQA
ncbi:translation initiation factor IF-2 [Deinococcus metallilatus]|uniref:Translation initiation factor IF-2 n=1 Tax=Deinococcus metallilatus TaxID=1211322 RepID=A0AAJ5F316_9DEIO|nr:translation initiation factor IF-2 [Deinococcus metallilatus]MBB5294250.1 translation initiation factor IF-2 [Deinococcus metallilatus]QBY09026.1 translation initiation factor IF-2 [Deinococcus metallilatus]RXJ10170.1 translation initiation factor IF-2 [Deinococcus metallilatus]TLK27893.1 translation initiation factor IF-2 [Deinococcus metallilatus]GMA16413.1 translation initiation factor IF-2 [Deinococcus metallilatus]